MLTVEERALVTDIGDRLLDLYAQRDEAIAAENPERVHALQDRIEAASALRSVILCSPEAE